MFKLYIRILSRTLELITDYSSHQEPYPVAYPPIGKSLHELDSLCQILGVGESEGQEMRLAVGRKVA
jgi:hypothetical protein